MADTDIVIDNLRGGMVDSDPPSALAMNEVVLAQNVEWFHSTFGERRAGCTPIDMTGSGLTGFAAIVHLSQWFPSNDIQNPELWAVGANPGASGVDPGIARRSGSVTGVPAWYPVANNTDPMVSTISSIYEMTTQALNGKLFFAYNSNTNFLHVWDGTTLRRTGLSQPGQTSAVAEGSGSYMNDRYFRIRWVTYDASGALVRRSEPGESRVFNAPTSPSIAGAAITRPTPPGEGETHWELEASLDNATFYRIATYPISTVTVNDETLFADGYADLGPLSEDIGDYLTWSSVKYLATDGDRLIGAGHWTLGNLMSNVYWSPRGNDPGVGSDERLPLTVNNTLTLDNYSGGVITGLTSAVNGVFYVFKWSRIYKLVATGDIAQAYEAILITDGRGALPRSVCAGVDENGRGCIYFIDPLFGPSRIGVNGVETIEGLDVTWARANLKAGNGNLVAEGLFYPRKCQMHWWVSVDGSDLYNFKIVLQTDYCHQSEGGGVRGGWSIATGRITEATALSLYWEWVSENGTVTLTERPFIGMTSPDFIQRCDVSTTDAGVVYTATIVTRPYIAAGLIGKFGAMMATLLATALTGATIIVRLIRDMGLETTAATSVSLTPTAAGESMVVRKMDDLRLSELYMLQVKVSDS